MEKTVFGRIGGDVCKGSQCFIIKRSFKKS